ncbi:YibE/F family protein [Nocardioides mangrovicus]|uniref:YibE/F family protein n=1 Tax=Nocardioides mangrovicus TaxID=2478913 RepID=A0A3L8NZC5_9ACTN|nr:YibE/F family protein [Nocardioides mangrovicus]RLV47903.1 YibE/F family protein [Nocardioides mangrovicus]
MAGGHAHAHSSADELSRVPVDPRARVVLVAVLGAVLVATVLGVVQLWPEHKPRAEGGSNAFAAPGVTFHDARVLRVQQPCASVRESEQQTSCGQVVVRVLSGTQRGARTQVPVAPEVSTSGLRAGDTLELLQTPASNGRASTFSFFSVERDLPIGLLAALFVLVVALVARLRGLLALVGLAFGAAVVVLFMLPSLLDGHSGLGVALSGSAAIMFVVLYLAHGLSMRTSAALLGTLVGVAITAVVGLVAIGQTRLSGVSDETGSLLSSYVRDLDFQGLLTCAVIVAGLGVLNDVTITQASAVWELRAVAPNLSRARLFARAMRIGRDHIASTIYTIVFAYAGGALSVLLLLYFYERPPLSLLSTEQIAEEVVRTLASAIGLVLAVPVTTAIAVATVGDRSSSRPLPRDTDPTDPR